MKIKKNSLNVWIVRKKNKNEILFLCLPKFLSIYFIFRKKILFVKFLHRIITLLKLKFLLLNSKTSKYKINFKLQILHSFYVILGLKRDLLNIDEYFSLKTKQ